MASSRGVSQAQADVLVTFVDEGVFSSESADAERLIVPRGTQLIGRWADVQPEKDDTCAVLINGEEWIILYDDATVVCPMEGFVPGEQRRIAETHVEQARVERERKKIDEARRLFACCLVEMEAGNAPLVQQAAIRIEYSATLMQLEARQEAMRELEQAASAYESACGEQLNRMVGIHLDYAEQAAQILTTLLRFYIHDKDQPHIRHTIERLLALNKLIKKRYAPKVNLLLWVTEGFSALGEAEQAQMYFEQAKRFYSQQLARYAGVPYLEAKDLADHLARLEAEMQTLVHPRVVKFTLTASTADDLDAILGVMRQYVPELVVTRSGLQASQSPRKADLYTATVRVTIRKKHSS
jgi:tetratricopeptide (TPR) repeat protein